MSSYDAAQLARDVVTVTARLRADAVDDNTYKDAEMLVSASEAVPANAAFVSALVLASNKSWRDRDRVLDVVARARCEFDLKQMGTDLEEVHERAVEKIRDDYKDEVAVDRKKMFARLHSARDKLMEEVEEGCKKVKTAICDFRGEVNSCVEYASKGHTVKPTPSDDYRQTEVVDAYCLRLQIESAAVVQEELAKMTEAIEKRVGAIMHKEMKDETDVHKAAVASQYECTAADCGICPGPVVETA